jgi:hypothetical protein
VAFAWSCVTNVPNDVPGSSIFDQAWIGKAWRRASGISKWIIVLILGVFVGVFGGGTLLRTLIRHAHRNWLGASSEKLTKHWSKVC